MISFNKNFMTSRCILIQDHRHTINRDDFSFEWSFTPEEPIAVYQSHLWLRVIVSEQDQTIERWNILVRDFPMENAALFGQPTVLWLIICGFSALTGLLLLILLLQKKSGTKNRPE